MNAATWTIRRLVLVAACIGLLLLSTPQRAGADVNTGSDPSSNGTSQVLACEAMGGTATVETHHTVAGGLHSVTVTCSGGMGGGWTCINIDDVALCNPTGPPAPTWGDHDPSIGNGDEVLEIVDGVEGTPPPAPVADSPKPPADSPRVAAPNDDQDQDTNKAKGKSKKGKSKKGGKGRKK